MQNKRLTAPLLIRRESDRERGAWDGRNGRHEGYSPFFCSMDQHRTLKLDDNRYRSSQHGYVQTIKKRRFRTPGETAIAKSSFLHVMGADLTFRE